MDYIIQPMETPEEMDGKGTVHWRCWHETYAGLVDAGYMETFTEAHCRDIAHRWPDRILVAKDGPQVIGFAAYGAYRDDTLPGCGEVYALYVLKKYQGKRIGYELMNAALAHLTEYPKIALWVLKGNEKAIRFYERYGFRFDGTQQEIRLGTPNTELRMIYDR